MTGEHQPLRAGPIARVETEPELPPSCENQSWVDNLNVLLERIDALDRSHQVLARLTKISVQHSQQVHQDMVELRGEVVEMRSRQDEILALLRQLRTSINP